MFNDEMRRTHTAHVDNIAPIRKNSENSPNSDAVKREFLTSKSLLCMSVCLSVKKKTWDGLFYKQCGKALNCLREGFKKKKN